MGQALKDDRCASTAAMAGSVADANDVRHDPAVWAQNLWKNLGGPGHLVYVDPYGKLIGGLGPLAGVIPRVDPTFATTPQLVDRWFSLPDDITFNESGTPDVVSTGGVLDRGRRYSYAYLLRDKETEQKNERKLQLAINQQSGLIELFVVVYRSRPIPPPQQGVYPNGEMTYPATGVGGTNGIFVSYPTPLQPPAIKRGHWILATGINPFTGQVQANFYRVTNFVEAGGGATVELEQNLKQALKPNLNGAVTVMPYVSEVFDKGTGWQKR